MNFVNKIKAKHNFDFINLILVLSPFIDLLICLISKQQNLSMINGLFRGCILLYILIYMLFYKNEKNYKVVLYSCMILIYIATFIINEFLFYQNSIKLEIVGIIKYMFYPLMLAGILIINNQKKDRHNILFLSAIIYSLFLVIPLIIGNGILTYAEAKFGHIGWFYSPNEISSIVGILFPFVFLKVLEEKKIVKKSVFFLISLIYIYSIFEIGTKTPIIAIIISVIMISFYIIYNLIVSTSKSEYKKNLLFLILLSFSMILIFINSSVYKNLGIHKDIYKYLETINDQFVDSSNKSDVIEDNNVKNNNKTIDIVNEDNDKSIDTENNNKAADANNKVVDAKNNHYKFNDNLKYVYNMLTQTIGDKNDNYKTNKLVNLIFSSRDIYFHDTYNEYLNSSITQKVLGMGVVHGNYFKVSKSIEIDFLDVLFNYGILGFILYFGLTIYLIVGIIKTLIKKFKEFMTNEKKYIYFVSLIICISISSVAGHILVAPAVSLFVAIIIIDLYNFDNDISSEKQFWNKQNIIKIVILTISTIILHIICLTIDNNYYSYDAVFKYSEGDDIFENYNVTKKSTKIIESKYARDVFDYYEVEKQNAIIATMIACNRYVGNKNYRFITIRSNINNLHITIDKDYNIPNNIYKYYLVKNNYKLIVKRKIEAIRKNENIEFRLNKNEYFDVGDEIFNDFIAEDNNYIYKNYANMLNELQNNNDTNYYPNVHSLITYGIIETEKTNLLYNLNFENEKIIVKYFENEKNNIFISTLKEGGTGE